jgi:hypothetical protein
MKKGSSKAWMVWILVAACTMMIGGCQAKTRSLFEPLFDNPDRYPEFIDYVQPEPGTVVSLSDPSAWECGVGQDIGAICVEILEEPLLRPNDDLYLFKNIRLTVDGKNINIDPSHEPTDVQIGYLDENEKIVATGVYSDLIRWSTGLRPGKHVAEILVWTSTGEEFTYRWAFEVTK